MSINIQTRLVCIFYKCHYIYIHVFRIPILSRLKMTTKMDKTVLYEDLINKSLKFLPFWNLVSVIFIAFIDITHFIFIFIFILVCKLLLFIAFI